MMEEEKDDTEEEINIQRDVIDATLNFIRDEGIISHIRHKRLKNDVRHWYLTKTRKLEQYRKRKHKENKSFANSSVEGSK